MRHAHEEPELLALVRRYVTPERRYMKLGGSLLGMRSPEYDRFVRILSADAGAITTNEITTLLEGSLAGAENCCMARGCLPPDRVP